MLRPADYHRVDCIRISKAATLHDPALRRLPPWAFWRVTAAGRSIRSRPASGSRRSTRWSRPKGRERATFLLRSCSTTRARGACRCRRCLTPPYKNTIALAEQPQFPGNLEIEQRLSRDHALERARDGRARQPRASRSSAATSRATPRRRTCSRSASTISSAPGRTGDLVYFQPHSAPGRLRARVPRRPADRGAARALSPRDRRQRALLVSAIRG